MKSDINYEIEIPEGVQVSYEAPVLKATGSAGTVEKVLQNPKINIEIADGLVKLSVKNGTKREKMHMGTFRAHVRNVVNGANEPFVYELKICSGHFPMSGAVNGNEFVLKNFLGESFPRKLKLKEGAKVNVDGDKITVESSNRELAGQVSADLESLTRITNRDRRIFQDGIFITKKAGKELLEQ